MKITRRYLAFPNKILSKDGGRKWKGALALPILGGLIFASAHDQNESRTSLNASGNFTHSSCKLRIQLFTLFIAKLKGNSTYLWCLWDALSLSFPQHTE